MQRLGDRLVAGVTRVQVADGPQRGSAAVSCHNRPAYLRYRRHPVRQLEHVLISRPGRGDGPLHSPQGRTTWSGAAAAKAGGLMTAKLRVLSALCALVAAVIVVWQTNPAGPAARGSVELRSTAAPLSDVSTTIKWPIVDTVDPRPFDPCDDIPLDVIQRI